MFLCARRDSNPEPAVVLFAVCLFASVEHRVYFPAYPAHLFSILPQQGGLTTLPTRTYFCTPGRNRTGTP